ncbi:MAG: hypothetical protein K2N09_06780 [Muribaculaceae bacterium]|nr:hypothetical protein [Muribaculaceae bacterium]
MSILRNYIALAALTAIPCMAPAQSITESVTVEGRYTPDIIPADRLALFPAAMVLTAPESPMTYDRKGVAASFAPDALSMPATGWRATKAYDSSRGYVDLRSGSWLNSSLSAGFSAIRTEDTRLNVYLQHNSTSLWHAWKEDKATGKPGADKRFRYDETIGADASHRFSGTGTLSGAIRYHFGSFNYYGTDRGMTEDGLIKAPTQNINDVYARVGWAGESYGKLAYSAEADVRYFGYKYAYILGPVTESMIIRLPGSRETVLNIKGDVNYGLGNVAGNSGRIGAGIRYSGVYNSLYYNVNRVEITPAYTISDKNYTLRLGVNAAVVDNYRKTRFRIAPDVRFSARKGLAALSATVGGGTHLRTLAWRHTMDYYSDPDEGCYEAAYSPLDVNLSLQLNPGGRWTAGIGGTWNTTLDETFGGLFQAMINKDLKYFGKYPEKGRIRGFSVAVNAGYEFCRYVAIKGKASWQPQDGSKGILNGFDRPEFTADVSAESSPIDKLSLRLDYRLRAKRWLLPGNMSRLDLSADYRVTDRISVGIELDNLLNRHEEFLPGLPMEGFNVMGGVQIVF